MGYFKRLAHHTRIAAASASDATAFGAPSHDLIQTALPSNRSVVSRTQYGNSGVHAACPLLTVRRTTKHTIRQQGNRSHD